MSGSFWKREISLGRKRKDDAAAEEIVHEPVAAPVEPERTVAERVSSYVPEPFVPDPNPAPALPPLTGDYGWLTEGFDPAAIPADMPAVSAPRVVLPRVSAPAPAAAAASEETTPAAPPVESSEQPTVEKKPFWKQELKLQRAPKAKKEKQPRRPREPKAKKPKKEKQTKADAPAVAGTEQVQKPPIWKRELSLGKPKAERAPKQPRETRAKAPKGGAGSAKGNLVGLKIGASQVVGARVANGSEAQLLQVGRLPLADGVVVGGELRDIETLAETLKELFAAHKLPKKAVRLGIANSRIGVRTFSISGIDDSQQLANAIRFRAQETLPIPLEEAVLDWQVLSEDVDPESGQTTREVMLVVAYRELVDRYLAACRKAGLRIVGIDLEAFAMLRALAAPAPAEANPNGAQVVVNVGHDRSTFAVSNGRICEFTRVLSWGGQSVSVAIARALDITPSQADPIKHALSLVAETAELPEGLTREALGAAREAVLRELQAFARELVSSLRFYQNQPGSLGIGELVLTGGTAHLPGLADELHRLIGVPVRVGDPLNRVALAKKLKTPDVSVGSLTVAIGLGIED